MFPQTPGPIGLFDSGYGGLTIFDKIHQLMPGYDYVYSAITHVLLMEPVRSRLFINLPVRRYRALFEPGCQLVILACNTASAKALRTIQQKTCSTWDPNRRVLGVIRPTVELVDTISRTKHIGIVGNERYDYVQFLYDRDWQDVPTYPSDRRGLPHVGSFGGE